jgi:hypothetical protein
VVTPLVVRQGAALQGFLVRASMPVDASANTGSLRASSRLTVV